MIVVCKQKECEYNKNGRCAQKVLIIENMVNGAATGSTFAICKYFHWTKLDFVMKHRTINFATGRQISIVPEDYLDPMDKIIIEEGRPAP